MRIAPFLLAASLVLGACSDEVAPRSSGPSPSVHPSEESQPSERGITRPDGTTVHNGAHGSSKRLVKVAIADLKRSGLWKPLTKHLYVIKVSSRLGRENVPEDGHLADAYLTAQIDDGVGGSLCDIMFFPTAMADDLARWRTYNAQGLLADPAPSRRQFWASILAHELAHCLDHGSGEDVAERWEAKALSRLRSGKG
jgi:hypothetical protein